MKKVSLLMSALMIVVFVITACAPSAATQAPQPTTAVAAPTEAVQVEQPTTEPTKSDEPAATGKTESRLFHRVWHRHGSGSGGWAKSVDREIQCQPSGHRSRTHDRSP